MTRRDGARSRNELPPRNRAPRRLALALLLLTALLRLGGEACAASAAGQPLFAAETFTLANGLQVVVLENRRAPVVVQMLFYRAGNADAPPGKSGIAHFLEHLMFKGTPSLAAGEFSHAVARMGGEDNAYTTEDYTVFHQTVASRHLARIMAMEADRMTNLILSESQVTSERAVIIEERRRDVDNDPQGQLQEMMAASLFLAHPYRLPVLGWEHEMEGLGRQDALDFYRRWYAPNNAVLVISGDVAAAEVRRLADSTYGKIPARALPARDRVREPTAYAPRRLSLADPDVRQPVWQRLYLAPGPSAGPAEEPYALQILAEILGGGPTSRLYRELVVTQGIAAAVGVSYDGSLRDYARFSLSAVPAMGVGVGSAAGDSPDATMAKLEKAIEAEIAKLLAQGIGAAELDSAKARLEADAVKARDGLMGPAEYLGTDLVTGISFAEAEAWPARVAAVTSADVMAAARKVLHPQTSVTGELLPAASPASTVTP